MSKDSKGSADGAVAEGFTEMIQAQLIADLQAARIEAGITSEEAAKTLGIPREVFDDVEAGRIPLNLTEIREYAYAVGAVIEYSVTSKSETSSSEVDTKI
jgi:DNA-binding XRE family transcriptional regulator